MLEQARNLLIIILLVTGLPASPVANAETLSTSRAIAGHLLDNIDQATWIAEGSGKRILYIFFDPDCPYCHKLYDTLRPLVAKRDLQLRWIPVGMLADTSLDKAAAILQADDPLAAFHDNEDNFGFSDSGAGGGIAPATTVSEQTRLNLAANLSLLQEQNLFVVPVAVFRANDGQGFMFHGAPPSGTLRQLLQYVK